MHTVLQRLAKPGKDRDEASASSVQSRGGWAEPSASKKGSNTLFKQGCGAVPARGVSRADLHFPQAWRLRSAEAWSPPVSLCVNAGASSDACRLPP